MDTKESSCLKGIAIILMFWHHLFGCGSFLTHDMYKWWPNIITLDKLFGGGAKICIALFAFVSGYGIYKTYVVRDGASIIPRIVKFLISYWTIVFFVGIPYLFAFHKLEIRYLFINLFSLLHNDEILYVSLSWYVKVYLELLLVTPVLKKVANKKYEYPLLELIGIILIPLIFSTFLPDCEEEFRSLFLNVLSSLKLLLIWFPVYYLGMFMAKYKLLEKLDILDDVFLHGKKLIMGLLLSIIIMVRGLMLFGVFTDVFCVSIFVVLYHLMYNNISNERILRVLKFLGKYSFQYWLLSGMFFLNTTEFTWILYMPQINILICVWNFLVLTPIVVLINWLDRVFIKGIENLSLRKVQ